MGIRAKSPRRAADEENTRIVNDFLDKHFYTKENGFDSVKRIDSRAQQIQGIDILFDYKGQHYISDEKAATAYINRDLKTFSFELAFVNARDEIMDGWLLNEELKTDSYVLVWIDEGDVVPFSEDMPDIEVLNGVDGIKVADIALVKKSSVLKYLERLGWTAGRLAFKCDDIITKDGEGIEMGNVWRNGCKFTYSKHLVEEPVNVLLPREKLIEISDFHLKYIR